ncbi:MAG: response regulator [Rhodocyclaceae bacterium]|nr:response regulator [Rhodocyclaceae bacterium]
MANVLIVDDTQTNLILFRHLLAKIENVVSHCFEDPLAALDWCQTHTPDLVLLDYMMPGINGIEFLKRFRQLPGFEDIPVAIITADTEMGVRYQSLEAGATDFLTKPVDKTELTVRVKNLLTLRRHQLDLADRAYWLSQEVEKATAEIRDREKDAILRLSKAAEFRDPETGSHIVRMAQYARLIAVRMGLPTADCNLLLETAPMHDIGKVGVSDAILLKPGKLDEAEFKIMQDHTRIGFSLLNGSDSPLLQLAAQIALTHHEKFDGSGYPNGIAGENIPLFGRICAVADVFDALTSERPYKKAWPVEKAKALLIEERGRHFDPVCIDAFVAEWPAVLEIWTHYQEDFFGGFESIPQPSSEGASPC